MKMVVLGVERSFESGVVRCGMLEAKGYSSKVYAGTTVRSIYCEAPGSYTFANSRCY
jgi:hypothetical protein